MSAPLRVALIGDRDERLTAHCALDRALPAAAQALGLALQPQWLDTDRLADVDLSEFAGFWCVPGSPYRDTQAALAAIRFAREQGRPFLGSCGGFQHAILEYARDVLDWADAEHAELQPQAPRAVIAPLTCPLVEVTESVRALPGTQLATIYPQMHIDATYRCRYGINPAWQAQLFSGPLRVAALDEAGEVRAIELGGHPFFMAVLFQPERDALRHKRVPLAEAWLAACRSFTSTPELPGRSC